MAKYLDSDGLEHFWGELKLILGRKADVSSAVSNVVYDTLNKKLVKTIGDNVSDIVTTSQIKNDLGLSKDDVGLNNVDNTADSVKSVASSVTAQALVSGETATPTSANDMHENNTYRLKAFLATSSMTTGKPPSDAHVLHFNWNSGTTGTGTRDSQLAISSGAVRNMYFRTQNSGVWSEWIQLYNSENQPSVADIGLDKVPNLTQKALHGGSALIRSANLNNVTTIGNYYAISDTIANSLSNSPTKKAFHMYVGLSDGETEGYEYQEIVEAETGARHYRRHKGENSDEWTDWTTLTEVTAGSGLGQNGNELYTKVFPAGESNTTHMLTELGASKYVMEEYPSDATDLPSEHGYIVMTATGSNVRYGAQLAMCKNADKIYFRRVYNSTYGAWKALACSAGAGISLDDGVIKNIGVLGVSEGTQNGALRFNINGENTSVSVHGLGTHAFDSTEYLPLSGGSINGTISASRSGSVGFEAENTNTNYRHKVSMIAGSTGSAGLYDNTFDNWIAYADKNGNILLNGKANSAVEFASEKSVTLTGDVSGTASSKAGWSLSTTLANSGVTANSYGPSSGGTLAFGGTLKVPYFTVDAKGRLTLAETREFTVPTPAGAYLPLTGGTLTGNLNVGETTSNNTSARTVAARNYYSTISLSALSNSTSKTAQLLYTPSGGSSVAVIEATYTSSAYKATFNGTADGVTLKVTNRAVATSSWVTNSDSNMPYAYSATISLTGVKNSHIPIIAFNPNDLEDFDLAPIANASAGSYTIFADTKPTRTITILSAAFI